MKCHKNVMVKSIKKRQNVSFVESFEAKCFEDMDALTKNSVALILTAEENASNHN